MFKLIEKDSKRPPIGCKYTKYNLIPYFIGDFFLIFVLPIMNLPFRIFISCNP